jgi:hypothetical protein
VADDIQTTADALLDCVCAALADIGRPTCACFNVIGDPMVIQATCCECEPGTTGELTIHLERLYDVDPTTLSPVDRVRPCKRSTVAADFAFVLTRCYPTVTEDGQLPDPEDQDAAARDLNQDAAAIWTALTCCEGVDPRIIREVAVEAAPQAGCSAVLARVTIPVNPRPVAEGS